MSYAIIDIGYNAMRAVVYESNELGSLEIFNNTFKSDVINLLNLDNLEVKHQTYLALQYLVHIFNRLSVTNIKCVATAVLRGHPRAQEFQQIIKQKFNINTEIISGEEEAYLTACGLLSGISGACGIVADLGGGSLELAQVKDKKVGILQSLPLGTRLINNDGANNFARISQMLRDKFGETHYQNLYLIGGALRLIGRSYIEFIHYPIKNLHNLEISPNEFRSYLDHLSIASMVKTKYELRVHLNAILVAQIMLDVFAPKQIVVSNYGLKEGVRFTNLTKEEQEKDIIYEKIKILTNFKESICHIDKYIEEIKPILILPDKVTINTIILAIMLSQYNKTIDKTFRSNYSVEFILSSEIPFTHRQRLMLSTIMSIAHSAGDGYINKLSQRIINKTDYWNSYIIGNFIKIARRIDGPKFQSPSFSFELKSDKYIEISTLHILPKLVFEQVCECLKNMGLARKNIY